MLKPAANEADPPSPLVTATL
jgi:hypothetical protein